MRELGGELRGRATQMRKTVDKNLEKLELQHVDRPCVTQTVHMRNII